MLRKKQARIPKGSVSCSRDAITEPRFDEAMVEAQGPRTHSLMIEEMEQEPNLSGLPLRSKHEVIRVYLV